MFQRKPAGTPSFNVSFYPEPADRVVRLKVGQVASDDGIAIGVIGANRRTTIVYTRPQP